MYMILYILDAFSRFGGDGKDGIARKTVDPRDLFRSLGVEITFGDHHGGGDPIMLRDGQHLIRRVGGEIRILGGDDQPNAVQVGDGRTDESVFSL